MRARDVGRGLKAARRAGAYVALGSAITFAVAVAFALWTPGGTAAPPRLAYRGFVGLEAGLRHSSIATSSVSYFVRSGWPLVAFEGEQSDERSIGAWKVSGTSGPLGPSSPRLVPLRPRPWHFVVNALFWALTIGAPLESARHLRRRLRRIGGRCQRCGYPVSGLLRCPECGNAVESGVPRRDERSGHVLVRCWACRLVLFIGLGALLNFPIAWFFAAVCDFEPTWRHFREFHRDVEGRPYQIFMVHYRTTAGQLALIRMSSMDSMGPDSAPRPSEVIVSRDLLPDVLDELRCVEAYGWPFLSLYGEHQFENVGTSAGDARPTGSLVLREFRDFEPPFSPPLPGLKRIAPLRPVWRPFISNALVYGLSLWTLAVVASLTSRAISRRAATAYARSCERDECSTPP